MDFLIMIPARGGSKGIKKKNIYPINGKPMIYYTLEILDKVDWRGDVVISSDSDEILKTAIKITREKKNYYSVKRPQKYSTDEASTDDVAIHAVSYMKETYNKEYDAIITMAPNLPLRTTKMFIQCVQSFENMPEEFDSQVCFFRTDEDMWIKKENNEFVRLFPNAPRRRQDREPLYVEKGSMTITKISKLIETGSVWGNRVHGYEIDELSGIDVHDENDIHYLEYMIKEVYDIKNN